MARRTKHKLISTFLFLIFFVTGSWNLFSTFIDFNDDIKRVKTKYQKEYIDTLDLLYSNISSSSEKKLDLLVYQLSKDINKKYKYSWGQFKKDYNNINKTCLTDIISCNIKLYNSLDKVQNMHRNGMFVATNNRIIVNSDIDTLAFAESNEVFELRQNFYMNVNNLVMKYLKYGYKSPISWSFKEMHQSGDITLNGDLKKIFIKGYDDLENIEDYQFLVYKELFEDTDILGNPNRDIDGRVLDNYKLSVASSFNLYDHIKANTKYMIKLNNIKSQERVEIKRIEYHITDAIFKIFILLALFILFIFIEMGDVFRE